MAFPRFICRLLAQFGIYPKGCPPKPPGTIGADRVSINVKQKDH